MLCGEQKGMRRRGPQPGARNAADPATVLQRGFSIRSAVSGGDGSQGATGLLQMAGRKSHWGGNTISRGWTPLSLRIVRSFVLPSTLGRRGEPDGPFKDHDLRARRPAIHGHGAHTGEVSPLPARRLSWRRLASAGPCRPDGADPSSRIVHPNVVRACLKQALQVTCVRSGVMARHDRFPFPIHPGSRWCSLGQVALCRGIGARHWPRQVLPGDGPRLGRRDAGPHRNPQGRPSQ